MKALYTIITSLLLFVMACGKKDALAELPDPRITTPLNRDSINQVYARRMQAHTNALPLRQIVEPGRLRPVDEGPTDTVFFVYREAMLEAIAQRNEFRLLEMLDSKIQTRPPADSRSLATFVTHWQLDKQKDSTALWNILQHVLQSGGIFSADRLLFTAPYYCATFPDTYDANVFGAIIGEGVRVRAAPDANAQILKTVSYDVVQILETSEQQSTISGETWPWRKVRLSDGKEGYVFGKFIGTPQDYRATFQRQPNGSWLMTALVNKE